MNAQPTHWMSFLKPIFGLDLPTNNLGPIEESFGARKMTKKVGA